MRAKSFKKSASSATIEAEDLLIEIFLCLPLCSVHRFKSVCKQWLSLITNPEFRKLWLSRYLKPSSGLTVSCYDSESGYNFIPFSSNSSTSPSLRRELKVVASCNGLLLCSTGSDYRVYNPTTSSMSTTLPKVLAKGMSLRCMRLAFDPMKSPYHKVVCCTSVFEPNDKKATYIHVYSSDTRLWTSIDKPFKPIGVYLDAGVYWNGSIHWIYASLYFNIKRQTLKNLPALPHSIPGGEDYYYFGESCDRLSYSRFKESASSCIISEIYELKRDYSGWFLKYRVDLDNYRYFGTSFLSVVRGEDEDDSFLVLGTQKGIVRYNLVSKTSEELQVLLPSRDLVKGRAFQYIEAPFCV